jgi:hypothetical protein
MKKYFKPVAILYSLTVLVSVLFVISLFSSLTDFELTIFFNSDTLYLPALYRDLFVYHTGIQGWYFNPSPNFFPDMIVYFILMFITQDFIAASFLYPLLQYIVFLVLILKLFQLVLKSDYVLFASFSNIILLLFFLVTFYSHDFYFTFYIVSISYHMGAFLMSLLCIILTIKYLDTPKRSLLVNLAWIGLLGIISDQLFVVMYCIPAISIILLFKKIYPFKKLKLILIINISILILGFAIFILIKNSNYIWIDNPHRIMDFKNSVNSFHTMIGHMLFYLKNGPYIRIIIISSILSFLSMVYLSITGIRKEQELSAFTIYCYLTVIYTLIVFFAPVINGNYTAWDSLRYLIYAFYISMLNIPLVIGYFLKSNFKEVIINKVIIWFLIICLIGSFWIGFNKLSISGLYNYFNYYPKDVAKMDKIAKENKLLYGVGNYWSAKYFTMFSKYDVKILPVFDNMFPYFHASNRNWFFDKNSIFNFIILNKILEKEEYKIFMGSTGIIIDSNELEIILLPKFRYDPVTKKPYLIDSNRINNK